jgi:hypothetical protein
MRALIVRNALRNGDPDAADAAGLARFRITLDFARESRGIRVTLHAGGPAAGGIVVLPQVNYSGPFAIKSHMPVALDSAQVILVTLCPAQ